MKISAFLCRFLQRAGLTKQIKTQAQPFNFLTRLEMNESIFVCLLVLQICVVFVKCKSVILHGLLLPPCTASFYADAVENLEEIFSQWNFQFLVPTGTVYISVNLTLLIIIFVTRIDVYNICFSASNSSGFLYQLAQIIIIHTGNYVSQRY